jgi:hypothetical protein
MNKHYFLTTIFLLSCISSFSQFQQVDETQEIFGLRLMNPVDYKQLDYYKIANDNSFNIYKVANKKNFTGNGYTISDAYVIIQKNLVWDIILPVEDSLVQEKIAHDLISSEFKQDLEFFDGKNIRVDFLPFGDKDAFWVYPHKSIDSIQNAKDNSGVLDLIGKKFSDPAVAKFISSAGSNYSKSEFPSTTEFAWKNKGLFINFQGKGDDATLEYIEFYLLFDGVYKPYKGQLPYDFDKTIIVTQLIDRFGNPVVPKSVYSSLSYPNFHFSADCQYPADYRLQNMKIALLKIF